MRLEVQRSRDRKGDSLMTNRKALFIMSLVLAFLWGITLFLESFGYTDIRKLTLVLTFSILGSMVGALLFFIGKRLP